MLNIILTILIITCCAIVTLADYTFELDTYPERIGKFELFRTCVIMIFPMSSLYVLGRIYSDDEYRAYILNIKTLAVDKRWAIAATFGAAISITLRIIFGI